MKRLISLTLFFCIFTLGIGAMIAQGPVMCPTRPTTDDSNACASTAFVHNAFAASPAGLIVGTSPITGGTSGRVLYDNAGVLGEYSTPVSFTVSSGTITLSTTPIGSANCAVKQSVSAVGALSTDAIIITFNSDPTSAVGFSPSTSGMLTIVPYPDADNVNIRVCNNTAAVITPTGRVLNWRIIR